MISEDDHHWHEGRAGKKGPRYTCGCGEDFLQIRGLRKHRRAEACDNPFDY